MTKTNTRNYHTPNNHTDHTTFGGLIHFSDFNNTYRGKDEIESPMARRIMSDWKFDQQCKQAIQSRNSYNNCKKGR